MHGICFDFSFADNIVLEPAKKYTGKKLAIWFQNGLVLQCITEIWMSKYILKNTKIETKIGPKSLDFVHTFDNFKPDPNKPN